MNEKEIIQQLGNILLYLEKSDSLISDSNWEAVELNFAGIATIRDNIKKNQPSVELLMEQNPDFKTEYERLKENIMQRTDQVINSIEAWKSTHTGKISESKNVLDNISRYYKPSTSSYYFDRNE